MYFVLPQVLSLTSQGANTEKLLPHVVKLLPSTDMMVKKLACWFVTQHPNEQLTLLAVNTLLKDCEDPSPMIRGLALRTLSNIPLTSVSIYTVTQIDRAMKDSSAYVRRTAVMACIKIHQVSPELIVDHGLINQLYGMIRDPDPLVVVNCLSALEELLEDEGGAVINRNIAHYLLNRLALFTEWGLIMVLKLLQRYKPKGEEETIQIMNMVDNFLKHNNSSVVMGTLHYFLHLVSDLPHLVNEVYNRAKSQILHTLASGNPELTYLLLQYIETLLPNEQQSFQQHFRCFFCKYNEPLYVKKKKIELLPHVTNDENIKEVLEELSMYCSDITPELSEKAICAVGKIATREVSWFGTCVHKLLELVQFTLDYVSSNVVQILQHLDYRQHGYLEETMKCIPKCIDVVNDDQGKGSIIWMLGEYGEHLQEAPYILETYIDGAEEETSSSVQLHLLTATVKLFIKRPAECQDMLGRLFETCAEGQDCDVKDRVVFLYNLLRTDIKLAEKVVCNSTAAAE